MHEAAARPPEGIVNLSRVLADSVDENGHTPWLMISGGNRSEEGVVMS